MDAEVEKILSFAQILSTIAVPGLLVDEFRVLVQSLGFEYFIISGLPWEGWEFRPLVAGTNFPIAWVERYAENNYLKDDAIARAAMASTVPFGWHKAFEVYATTDRARAIADEWRAAGLVDGVSFPYLDCQNRLAIISLASGQKVSFAPHLGIVLQGLAPLVYKRLCEISGVERPKLRLLSAREVEVLRLVSSGYTLDQAALVLHLNKSTVRFHLAAAKEKLGCTSLPQLVAAAIRTRQI